MVRIAAIKSVAQRFSFVTLLVTAVAVMMVGKFDAVFVESVRIRVTDAVAPILNAFARPAATAAEMIEEFQNLADLRETNERLRAENAALHQYQQAAFRLEAENLSLRSLLNYRPDVAHSVITARVIADNSGAFVRSLVINYGNEQGIRDGQAAIGGQGLIGRIVQTGSRSARILLVTDLNARIPIVVEGLRHRGILAGDNTPQPRLLHLPADSVVEVGDRISTSGHGGMFPPGIAVGVVASIEDGAIRVQPVEDPSRVEFARIFDFDLEAGGAHMASMPGYGR